MSHVITPEAPLDLLNAGRDELIAGSGPVRIVPQIDQATEQLAPPLPCCQPRDAGHREMESQSAILRRSDLEKLAHQKPR